MKDTMETEGNDVPEKLSYSEKLKFVSVIANPMASKKLTKKLYKLISKASKHKFHLRTGLKEVQTRIRKEETGIVVLAGDVTPVDIICHLPAVCEARQIPYAYTPSRADLGKAMGVRRTCMCVLIRPHKDYKELYDEIHEEIEALPLPGN
ncbi:snoRNA-binding protein [Chamberlinius hualienensis]